jgi:hypothetical protein
MDRLRSPQAFGGTSGRDMRPGAIVHFRNRDWVLIAAEDEVLRLRPLTGTSDEARWRAERFCLPPTPKHVSWLNMAELEISALERQCMDTVVQRSAGHRSLALHLMECPPEISSLIPQNQNRVS